MSTGNFCYQNRCVVVSDEDYEDGNVPSLGEWVKDFNRSYPSRELDVKGSEELHATKIVITAGYYEGSCIDFIQDEDRAVDYVINNDEVATMFDECNEKNYRKVEKLLAKEKKIANKIIDRLKDDYGYIEVKRVTTFSNGETIYEEVK